MEPRPPKRPRTSVPGGTAGGSGSARQWDQPVQPGQAVDPQTSSYDTSIYRPVEMPEDLPTGMPFKITPKSQRGHRWLGPLLGALLLAALVGGIAWAVTKALNGEEKRDDVVAVTTPVNPAPTESTALIPTVAVDVAPTGEPEVATEVVVEPTVSVATEQSEAAAPTATEVPVESEPSGTEQYIPDASLVGPNYAATNEGGTRSEAEVAAAIGADGATLLAQWGWQENVYQEYAVQADAVDPNATSFTSVSVHRFDTEEGAQAALQGFSDIVVASQGLADVEPPQVGDAARGLAGPGDGVNIYVLYVRDGIYLLRLGGASNLGDPAADVNALAEELLS